MKENEEQKLVGKLQLITIFFLAGKKWFPHAPGEPDSNPAVGDTINLNDVHHGIAMGVVDSSCDDGKVSRN